MSSRGFEKHARTFTILTFVSRITGFARDDLIGRNHRIEFWIISWAVP